MYTTCMFCGTSLGTNEVIETFPVGRRLAFDESKGRLWVVCRSCERWNLTPMEERWEAVEDCERIFRETSLRTSTENIGLARVPEGLELVRIGKPLRNEFAAWRYGDQFGKRRTKYLTYTIGAGVAVVGLTVVGPMMAGISVSSFAGLYNLIGPMMNRRHRAKLHADDGRVIKVPVEQFGTIRLRPGDEDGTLRLRLFKGKKAEWFTGPEAERFASRIIPKVNRSGAKRDAVKDAVRAIEDAGHPERFVKDLVAREDFAGGYRDYGAVAKMPSELRLALEMSLHEEDERRALEGELWRLERAWEEAEEIAAIADDLLLPDEVTEKLQGIRSESLGPVDTGER